MQTSKKPLEIFVIGDLHFREKSEAHISEIEQKLTPTFTTLYKDTDSIFVTIPNNRLEPIADFNQTMFEEANKLLIKISKKTRLFEDISLEKDEIQKVD